MIERKSKKNINKLVKKKKKPYNKEKFEGKMNFEKFYEDEAKKEKQNLGVSASKSTIV